MQCVTPMFRRYERGNHKKGSVVSRNEVMQGLELNENNIRMMLKSSNSDLSSKYAYEKIPCQHCWACQLNYSAQWATRIMLECKKYEHNYFVTLTYDDEHVPLLSEIQWEETYKDTITGEIIETKEITLENDGTFKYTLIPEHAKIFMHDLRQKWQRKKHHQGIKYYLCGEYGSETERPHIHIILMNCPLDLSQFYDTHIDQNWKAHWKSKELEEIWDKGMIDVAEVEWSCAAYVARYCTKKIDYSQDKTIYYKEGRLPEFPRMSKGIGFDYFKEHYKEIYKNDELIMRTVKGNIGSVKPPKSFDRKYKEIDPKGFKLIQKSRKRAAERAESMIQQITDYTDLQRLRISANKLETKMSMLPRAGTI